MLYVEIIKNGQLVKRLIVRKSRFALAVLFGTGKSKTIKFYGTNKVQVEI